MCLSGFPLLDVVLFSRNFEVFVLDVEAETVVDAHVLVGHPDQGEESDEISAPAGVEHVKAGNNQEYGCDVVAETVFAGEQIKKFAPGESACLAGLPLTIFSRFTKDFFVGDGPGNAGDGNGQHEEPDQLDSERDGESGHGALLGCVAGLRVVET